MTTLTDSFVALPTHVWTPEEWTRRLHRNFGTISSLAGMALDHKYYYEPKDGKFYKSNWTITEHVIGWMGSWAEWLECQEEKVYRTLWKMTAKDTVQGVLSARLEIISTLVLAGRMLDKDKNPTIDNVILVEQINYLFRELEKGKEGLVQLEKTYEKTSENSESSKGQCIDKHQAVKAAVAEFFKDTKDVADELMRKIERKRNGNKPPPVEALSSMVPIPWPKKIDKLPILQPPIPFFLPDETEGLFNQKLPEKFSLMVNRATTKIAPEKPEDAETWKLKLTMPAKILGMARISPASTVSPWSIHVSCSERIYFYCRTRLVPAGEGGCYKTDKLVYALSEGESGVKLRRTLLDDKIKSEAKQEENILMHCARKNLPNVAKTYEVIYKFNKYGVEVQLIIQKYYEHRNLDRNLFRLAKEPAKIKKIILGIMTGLAALHEEKIIHRDIKAGNIVLDQDDNPFFIDFGFSCYLGKPSDGHFTPMYVSPDNASTCTYEEDIWQFGMLMYGLLKDPVALHSKDPDGPYPWLVDANSPSDVPRLNKTLKDKLFPKPTDVWMLASWQCLQLNPAERPPINQLRARLLLEALPL